MKSYKQASHTYLHFKKIFKLIISILCHRKLISLAYVLAIWAALSATMAMAECTTKNANITLPDLALNRDNVPIDSPIGSEFTSPVTTILTCTSNPNGRIVTVMGSYNALKEINGRNILKTSNPGIGFAYGFEPTADDCLSAGLKWSSKTNDSSFCSSQFSAVPKMTLTGKFHFQLYKIANISGSKNTTLGTETPGVIASETNNYTYTANMNVNTFNVTTSSCSLLSASSTNVSLPTISKNGLSIQSTTAGSTPFSITINCPSPTNLNITFTDNNNIGQTTTILKNTSTATGVGVQLSYKGNIISFGPDSAEPGTINQIVLDNNMTGTQTFQFNAAYIRTGTITPGAVAAKATFTLSYQ
ncbi:fimbrial protein [Aquitalea sp. LB_tupeE]|uniref:fimbrial protein n=1 Tax=Aquitalea sp. LB_tupeE TaxID=2748078 RepID=UPI0015BBCFCF|nr:fimbrial protein [Aquitalea sp. LB_tupeE]NWK77835.1 fimbrial protein [Aquitalea sp. LB_tupeE]